MQGELIKIHEVRENDEGKFQWLEFKMEDGSIRKTWVFHHSKNYQRMWKPIIYCGVGTKLRNLSILGKDLIHPNSDMSFIPFGDGFSKEQEEAEHKPVECQKDITNQRSMF